MNTPENEHVPYDDHAHAAANMQRHADRLRAAGDFAGAKWFETVADAHRERAGVST